MMDRFIPTACLYFAFFGSGLVFNSIPTTFNDIEKNLKATTGDISVVYTYRSAGYLFGAIAGGLLLRMLDRRLILSITYAGMGLTIILLPRCSSLGLFFALSAINGACSGTSDAGTNVWLLNVHKPNSGPYIQGLYFCFAIGVSAASLLSVPFLAENNGGTTQIQTLFLMIGAVVLLGAGCIFAVYWSQRRVVESTADESPAPIHNPAKYAKNFVVLIVCLASVLILIYSGFEICYSQFMVTFITKSPLNISTTDANYMNFGMNISYTIFRGLAAFINLAIAVEMILVFNFAAMMIGTVLLFVFFAKSFTMLFLANIFMGIGFSSLYPSIFAFIEKHVEINDVISAVFVFFSGLTAIVYPILIGGSLDKHPTALLYLNVFSIIASSGFFALIYAMIRLKKPQLLDSETEEL